MLSPAIWPLRVELSLFVHFFPVDGWARPRKASVKWGPKPRFKTHTHVYYKVRVYDFLFTILSKSLKFIFKILMPVKTCRLIYIQHTLFDSNRNLFVSFKLFQSKEKGVQLAKRGRFATILLPLKEQRSLTGNPKPHSNLIAAHTCTNIFTLNCPI